MSSVAIPEQTTAPVWRLSVRGWFAFAAVIAMVSFAFHDGIREMVHVWGSTEEYSYGYLIPVLALFLAWQRLHEIERADFSGTWWGVAIVLIGVLLYVLGELSTIYTIVQYALLVVIAGLLLAFTGRLGVALFLAPFSLLLFMIPLPNFLLNTLSTELQLVSTALGVWFIRLFDISVYMEGNVIDLGQMQLQVVDACSGLRYLFPLMALGFIAVCFYRAAFWRRAVVFLSTVPITIVMNSIRIGIIGVMADRWGRPVAEGFLHDFEGWSVFMVCAGLLVAEIWLLNRLDPRRLSFREAFGFELPAVASAGADVRVRRVPAPFAAAMAVIAVGAVLSIVIPQRGEVAPTRETFVRFPDKIGQWTGVTNKLEGVYLDVLKLDDYLLADFADDRGNRVNLYIAYYASQRKGESAHSPRTCIPGGGWEIRELAERQIDAPPSGSGSLQVNRVMIRRGEARQLVYYWFQQRGRIIANEYLVKWYLFWDSLTRRRTDGALVRVTAAVKPGEDEEAVDRLLQAFIGTLRPALDDFVPR